MKTKPLQSANARSMLARYLTRSVPLAVLVALAACGKGGGSDTEMVAAAKAALEKKDAKGAVIQLKNALQKNPKSAEARLLLGKTLLEGGDPVTALVELLKAQELQVRDDDVIPDIARALVATGDLSKLIAQYGDTVLKADEANADLKTSLATAFAYKNDMSRAQSAVNDALRFKPGYGPALIMQARLNAADGKLDEALAQLDKVLETTPGDERAGVLKSDFLLMGKRDPDGAVAALRKVLAARPDSFASRAALANILFQMNKLPEVKAEFEQMKKAAPNHPETLLLEGQLAFVADDLKATRDVTAKLIKAMPDNIRVLELAGAAELRGKNYAQAESFLTQVLKANPRQQRARLLLAQTFLRSGQADKAIDLLKPLIESPQADAISLSLAGEAYLQTGDNKRSEEAFARATKAAPGNSAVRTSAAIAALARGDTSPAAMSALEAVANSDSGTRGDLALVSAKLRNNDTDGALKAIAALEKKSPEQPLPHLLRGRVLALKKDLAGAAASFNKALEKDPNYFPAVASLAALDLAANTPDKARERFDAYLKANPKSFQAKMAMAELQARTGAPNATVITSLREAAKMSPGERTPHLVLIRRLIESNDGKGALAAAQDAAAALPNDPTIQEALGEAQIAGGDAERAVLTFKKLSAANPKNVAYMVRLADSYRALKDIPSATSTLKRVLESDPDFVPARGALVGLALMAKRPDEAQSLARELQKRKPKDAAGYQLESEVEASRQNWDGAAALLRTAMTLDKSPGLATKLHAALTNGGKKAEADKVAADWVKEHPKDGVFKFYLGDMALARKDYPQAEAIYREVLELQPGNALAMNNIAWLMITQNKPGALTLAEKANALLPDRAALLDTLAMAQEAEKQLPKAIETQLRAVRLQPEDPSLTLRLGKLYMRNGDKARAKAEFENLAKLGSKFAGQEEVASLLKQL